MQIIQPPLGNNIHPLGIISPLSNTHRLILRKESDFLHCRTNFISPIQKKSPLAISSQFLLSREPDSSIQPVIGWDTWDNPDINSGFPFINFNPFDSINSEENNNFDNSEVVKSSTPEILSTIIDRNIINDISSEINIPKKSQIQTKSNPKPRKKSPEKSKTKSTTKKSAKSSPAKKRVKASDETNTPINPNPDILISSKPPFSNEINSEIVQTKNELDGLNSETPDPLCAMDTFLKSSQRVAEVPDAQGLATASLSVVATGVENPPTEVSSSAPLHEKNYPTSPQQNIPLNNTDFISSTIPSTSLNDEAQPTLFRNIANEQPQVTSELPSSLPSTKPLISENISPLDKNLLEENTSQLTSNFPVEFSLPHNENEKIDLPSNLNNNQEQILTKASKVNSSSLQEDIKTTQSLSEVDIPNISVSLKQLPQDIDPDKFPYQVDNPNTTPLINLIQEQQSSQTSNYPSPEQKSTDKSYDPETIIVIEPDIISQTYRTEFDPDNFPSDNSLKHIPLSSTNNSPSLENTLGVDSSPTLPDVSVTKNYIGEQQEIDSSEPSKSLPSLPVQLTPKLPVIVDIDKFSTNSDNNEELVNSELESTVAPNISNVASNIISLQPDNNLENAINDSIENQPVLVPNEFVATPRVSNISPEIIESPVVNTTSPEIVETSKVSDISSEIIESPAINATPYEIGETPIINNIAPEIIESPVVSSRFSELVETPKVSDISSEIVEAPRVSATSTEIVETSKVSDISSEIVEKPRVSDVSTNVAQTSSIFRKIVENEEIVESELLDAIANSENSEISSFIDSSDNQNILEKPTFTQNRVSIPPEVEQDTTIENLPAPKGYATGGKVTDSRLENKPYIAPSDTVPAMLTPGEFVINTRDAQKNLPLLHHINSGGTLEDVIAPSLQPPNAKEPGKLTSPHSTKVDSFSDNSLQLKPQESNSLIPSSLGLNVGKQQLSILNSPQISSVENKTPDAPINSPQYSSPPLIFRKANSTTQTSSQWSNAPSQWSSVEDLFNENDDDEFTSFFNSGESQNQNSEFSNVFTSSESPQMFAKQLPVTRGFADGGEVIAPENTELVTETIESTAAKDGENAKDDTADIEALAREIYSRLRQRLEIERERHGGYSGRLAW